MTQDDWALMRACAVEVLSAARPWWSATDEHHRSQLANQLVLLSEAMKRQDARRDPTAPPTLKGSQEELVLTCFRAAGAIRVNVRPYDERGAALWEAGARLAYATLGMRPSPRR